MKRAHFSITVVGIVSGLDGAAWTRQRSTAFARIAAESYFSLERPEKPTVGEPPHQPLQVAWQKSHGYAGV
jgi:hypothetical protein